MRRKTGPIETDLTRSSYKLSAWQPQAHGSFDHVVRRAPSVTKGISGWVSFTRATQASGPCRTSSRSSAVAEPAKQFRTAGTRPVPSIAVQDQYRSGTLITALVG